MKTSKTTSTEKAVTASHRNYSVFEKLFAYLQILRPANILTAIADILAGVAIAGAVIEIINMGRGWFYIPEMDNIGWLMLSTACLYGGGIVLNDYFDAAIDQRERPERAIPSGKIPRFNAGMLGILLLFVSIQTAFIVSYVSGLIAIGVAALIVLYDSFTKHHLFLGPLNMGLCRGGNLLLGISIFPSVIPELWFVAIIPVIYIAAITLVSRGEVHGGDNINLGLAAWLYTTVIGLIVALAFFPFFQLRLALPYIVLFGLMIFRPLRKARKTRQAVDVGKAVKYGVLALVMMNAAMAAGFAGWDYALLIALLLPVSLLLAKIFSVT